MARLSVNEMTTYRWSFEEDVVRYRALGIPAIGVWRQKVSDFGEEKAVELIAETGMPVSSLMWAGGFTGSEGHTFREAIDDAIEAIRLAAALHAPTLVVHSGARAGHTHNHARRLFLEALQKLAPIAGEHGVRLAIEPMHPDHAREFTFLTTLADALLAARAVDHPAVGITLDTYHMGLDPTLLAQLPAIAPLVALVHLADGRHESADEQDRTPLGRGRIPLAEIVASLKEAGYQGDYEIALFGPELENIDYNQLLTDSHEYSRQLALT